MGVEERDDGARGNASCFVSLPQFPPSPSLLVSRYRLKRRAEHRQQALDCLESAKRYHAEALKTLRSARSVENEMRDDRFLAGTTILLCNAVSLE